MKYPTACASCLMQECLASNLMVQCRTRGPNLEEVNKTLTLGTLWLIEVVHSAGAQSSYRGDSLPAYKFTRVGGTTHLLARQINYSNRMLSGCKMSYVKVRRCRSK